MKSLVILGAGTAGTIMANKLSKTLDPSEWKLTIVDGHPIHYYQPGFLFIPFGVYEPREVCRTKTEFLPQSIEYLQRGILSVDADSKRVRLEGGDELAYDILIIATGTDIRPGETEGLLGDGWRKNIFDFYTYDGSVALGEYLRYWDGGRLILNVTEMPIKCPVAPLEFLFLADWFFTERGIRDKVDLVYATPLDGAFTKPRASALLGKMLEEKGIQVIPDFNLGEVRSEANQIESYDGQTLDYDLFVTIPTNMGDDVIERSGIGDELNYVPTDKHTLAASELPDVFVIGDATNLPSSKAGSVAHFEAEILADNIIRQIRGQDLVPAFDGHANCFVESGYGKALLIDFNYDTEPLPGKFPLPTMGPFTLLGESKMNHWGKLMFRWMYWNQLLRGVELPLESQMLMAGKEAA